MKIVGILTCVFVGSFALAQFSNFNTQKNWSMNKKELLIGAGPTQFLGDLGGSPDIGQDYSLKDMDFKATSFNITLGYRYRFHPVFATTSSLNFGRYQASDLHTTNPGRAPRSIDIKSTLITLYQRIEYLVYVNEKVGKRNSIPGLKGMKDKNQQFYIHTGLGISYYNPQGGKNSKFEGVALRPLSTEGQNLAGGTGKAYKFVTAVIPFGFGYRFGLNRFWRMSIDATYFKTFTDYMDDVSTTYFSHAQNNPGASPEAIYFSNPSENWQLFQNGDKRGDNEKDAFFYVNVTFSKNVTYRSYQRGKPIKWRGVRAKF